MLLCEGRIGGDMKRRLRGITAFLAALVACAVCCMPIVAAEGAKTVRVLLSVSSASVTVKISGAYHIEGGEAIPAGSYTVSVSGSKVHIAGNGIDKTVGAPLTLVRDEAEINTKNLSISGTKYGTVNYLGDMLFYVNSSKLQVVNRLPVEQYLYGVVGYEMSDSWPLEALKAQAVCARGYVAKAISGSGKYDIGDTSSDQVYRGFNASYKNVIAAVDGTKGKVLRYNNSIITTYFAASNGGQTELPGNAWGGGADKNKSYPYLVQQDDPYDLENTSSLTQTIFIPKDVANDSGAATEIAQGSAVRIVNCNTACNVRSGPGTSYKLLGQAPVNSLYTWVATEGDWFKIIFNGAEAYVSASYAAKVEAGRFVYSNAVLSDMQVQAQKILAASGVNVQPMDIKIISVNSMANGTERWPGTGSRSYVSANASLTVQYFEQSSGALSKAVDMDISIALMNKKGGDYVLAHDYIDSNLRLRFVTQTEGGYTIFCGRYGHGVGMSQRGAQTMAKNHGMTYDQILAFYYPGAKLGDIGGSSEGGDSSSKEPISSKTYKISGSTITKVAENTAVAGFVGDFSVGTGSVRLFSADGKAKDSGNVGTGDVLKLFDSAGKELGAYSVVIYGDVNGDGKISALDLLRIQKYLLGTVKLSGAYATAADVTKDGSVKALDLLRIQKHLLGTQSIKQ